MRSFRGSSFYLLKSSVIIDDGLTVLNGKDTLHFPKHEERNGGDFFHRLINKFSLLLKKRNFLGGYAGYFLNMNLEIMEKLAKKVRSAAIEE